MITGELYLAAIETWAGIFCFATAIFTYTNKNLILKGRNQIVAILLCSSILIFSGIIAWHLDGVNTPWAYYLIRISNFLVFILPYVDEFLFLQYITMYMSRNKLSILLREAVYFICMLGIALVVVGLFNHMYYSFDENNAYIRGPMFGLSQLLGILMFAIIITNIFIERKQLGRVMFYAFVIYAICPVVAVIFTLVRYTTLSQLNLGIAAAVLIMFMILSREQNIVMLKQKEEIIKQRERLLEQERQVSELKISIVLSQIRPHFMFNSLNAIYYLCEKDTEMAQKAISDFSDYLRGNMDSMSVNNLVPFDRELRHIRAYLGLEKMRFGDDLTLVYEFEEMEFYLPPLTVQPIVENAVKHGVGKKNGGGTVIMHTCKYDGYFEIRVSDDGVGFDPKKKDDDGKVHIGIDNVKKRLNDMCGGKLIINSKVGEGTVSIIKIPEACINEQYMFEHIRQSDNKKLAKGD